MQSGFNQRLHDELDRELEEVAFWNDLVARGVVEQIHAAAYISKANGIIATKRFILSTL